jgi:hypothetical protein
MLKGLWSKKMRIPTRRDKEDLETLFSDSAVVSVLDFIESTDIGKRRDAQDPSRLDEWDMDRLDREGSPEQAEEEAEVEGSRGGESG